MQAHEDEPEAETAPLPPLLYEFEEPELPTELLDKILNLVVGPNPGPRALGRYAAVGKYFNAFAQPLVTPARLVQVANCIAFQGNISVYSSNDNNALIAVGLQKWMFLPEMQVPLLQTLLMCPPGTRLHYMCAKVVIRIMDRYPHDVQVQRAAAEFLVRKNTDLAIGPYFHSENVYGDNTVPCDEAASLCTALEQFGDDEIVCKFALQSLSKLAEFWHAAYTQNPTHPEYWGAAHSLAAIFGLANGRRNRIVLNAMRCIDIWSPTHQTSGASEIVGFGCKVLEYTLQGEALASVVTGGPPGLRCLIGVDKVLLGVLVHNRRQRMPVMQYTQRMAWKQAKVSAVLVLQKLVEAKRLSIHHNIPQILTQLAIDGDVAGLDIMTTYCTDVARQGEFIALGTPFWDWINVMMLRNFIGAPDPDSRQVIVSFLRFLAALGRDNYGFLRNLMMQSVHEQLCRVLRQFQELVADEATHKKLKPMKLSILALLATFFACPQMHTQWHALAGCFPPSLFTYIAESMPTPSESVPTPLERDSSSLTAVHCMCILSKLMPHYQCDYSPPIDALFKKVVSCMDSDPNNTTLMANAMSLLCVLKVDCRSHFVNMAIVHAFSGLYKFASNVNVCSACVRFLYYLCHTSIEVKNIICTAMQCQIELHMSPIQANDAPPDPNIITARIRPNQYLAWLADSREPHIVADLAPLILDILAVTTIPNNVLPA